MMNAALPGRATTGALVLTLVLAFVLADLRAHPIDPLAVPAPAALGSGAAPSGAHCTQG